MAVLKYYDAGTSSWKYIAASTTANFTTWKKTMSGGETSVSGTDDNSVTLSYTAGLEQVFINGALQARGSDYTATTGTTITGLSALGANDIVSVVCYAPFNVTNTYTKSETDGIAAAAPGLRMVVPTSVAVGSGSGSVDANGAVTFSGSSSISLNGCFSSSYNNYKVMIYLTSSSGSNIIRFRTRAAGTDLTTSTYRTLSYYSNSASNAFSALEQSSSATYGSLSYAGTQGNAIEFDIFNPQVADYTHLRSTSTFADSTNMFSLNSGTVVNNTTSYDGFTIYPNTTNISGTVRVYGYKN
jgi:uncharacterized Zn-binding protein involved in type VI secretion